MGIGHIRIFQRNAFQFERKLAGRYLKDFLGFGQQALET